MSNDNDIHELRKSFLTQTRSKLIHYHEAHPNSGLLTRILNLVDEGLVQDQFGVCLRNDLVINERSGIRGWKNVKLVQTVPG